MSQSNLRLTTAIEANANGIKSMRAYRASLVAERDALTGKIDTVYAEIVAREAMQVAMVNLQRLMPNDETVKFVVPSSYE